MLNKKLIISLILIGTKTSYAAFNMNGGTVHGGTMNGNITAKDTTFNGVTFLNADSNNVDLTNCTLAGCQILNGAETHKPSEAESSKAPSTSPRADLGSSGSHTVPKAPLTSPQADLGSGGSNGDPKGDLEFDAVQGERSGVLPKGRSDNPHGVTGEYYDSSGGFEGSFFKSSENTLRPGEAELKNRNMQNARELKQWMSENNPYSMRDSFDPDTLKPRSDLPQVKDNVPGTQVGDTMFLDPQMGAIKMQGDALYDRWGNRMGTLKYDSEYKKQHGYSGSNYLHFDQDYKIAGTLIVPKGFYKNMATGDIYDPSGKKWGEMTNDGTIFGVPSLLVERTANRGSMSAESHDFLP